MNLLQLQKKRDDAMAAVASATTDKARAKALSDLETASLALATFQTRIDSKMIKKVKKEETYEEEDEDEEEEEDEESDEKSDDEPKKPASKKSKSEKSDDDDDDSDDDDDDSDDDEESEDEEEDADEDEDADEEEDEEEDEKAAASAISSARSMLSLAKKSGNKALLSAARTSLRAVKVAAQPKSAASYRTLKAACERVTGKKTMNAIVGALEALKASAASTEKLANDVAKIKAKDRQSKVDAMLATARREGKIVKSQIEQLRKQPISFLKAFLENTPKQVRSLDEGALQGIAFDGRKDGEERRAAHLDAQSLSADQRELIESMARDSGKSFDEFFADMQKTAAKKANGAARR